MTTDTMYDLEKQTSLHSSLDSTAGDPENHLHHKPHAVYSETGTNINKPDLSDIVSRISTSHDGTYIYLGKRKFLKEDLLVAFGGTLNPGWAAPSVHKFGNPAPLGLSAFALTTFVLSLVNAGAMGVSESNVVTGLAMFYGGLVQLLAGMWEMSVENTFGALALSSYGGFWMSFAAIYIPWFNILGAYEDPTELENAVGFYLLGWAIFTFMLILCTMKSTVSFCGLFVFLDLTFLMLALGKLAKSDNCTVAGGILGIITAFISWYNAFAGVANPQNSYVTLKAHPLPKLSKES